MGDDWRKKGGGEAMITIFELGFRLLTLLTLGGVLVFVVGIVWRVEAELDVAYKWFSLAVAFFLVSEVIEVLPWFTQSPWGGASLALFRLLAAASLFLGMYYMRDLVRRMDGEKK